MGVYQAPIVAVIIAGAYAWRMITFRLEKHGTKVPLFAHYYSILYLLITVLTLLAVVHLYTDVLAVSDWLDKKKVREFVLNVMENSAEDASLLENEQKSPFNI